METPVGGLAQGLVRPSGAGRGPGLDLTSWRVSGRSSELQGLGRNGANLLSQNVYITFAAHILSKGGINFMVKIFSYSERFPFALPALQFSYILM